MSHKRKKKNPFNEKNTIIKQNRWFQKNHLRNFAVHMTNNLMETISNPSFFSMIQQEIPTLRGLAIQLTRNQDDAKDLVQETILKALKNQSRFAEGNLRGWLLIILRNSFINNYRRMTKRKTFIDSTENTYFIDFAAPKTENLAELKFIRKDLEQAIDELSSDLRVPFMLNLEGFKYQEISEALNMPLGTVKTRIFVAKRTLRKKLSTYEADFRYTKQANE
jgi:RNA polymerase sigma factor (sigma-70 family)